MLKEAIGLGETEEEALKNACSQLGVEADGVDFEIMERPSKKKFGIFGGTPAKVRAFVKVSPAEVTVKYVKDILKSMGFDDIKVNMEKIENGVNIKIDGDKVGIIIGKRGETLEAIQYLASLVANNAEGDYFKVTVNIGNYREKREKTLTVFGRKLAAKAVKTGRNFSIEPMNSYERRIIHSAIQNFDGAVSWSEGQGMERHVIVGPDPQNPPQKRYNNRNEYSGKRRHDNRNSYNRDSRYGRSSLLFSESNTDIDLHKREPINEGENFSLYGKVSVPERVSVEE